MTESHPRNDFASYHAHVYFDEGTVERARQLCQAAAERSLVLHREGESPTRQVGEVTFGIGGSEDKKAANVESGQAVEQVAQEGLREARGPFR